MNMTKPLVDPLSDAELAASLDGGFASNHVQLDNVRVHYVEGGAGEPLLLLGGWPQTWWQWHKVMPALARRNRVIAVDLRGMGGSSRPQRGYDKKTMAHDIRELVRSLNLTSVSIAGHDIGAMVAYAYAANYPEATSRIALLDVPHPEPSWNEFRLLPQPDQHRDTAVEQGDAVYVWWFALNQVRGLPDRVLAGRMRHLLDWLFTYQARDPWSIDEHSRQVYARAYNSPDAIRAGNGWYQTFTTDIVDGQSYPTVTTPLLALGGEHSNYGYLRELMPTKGTDVRVVEVPDCGHYLPEEQPEFVVDELTRFFG
jgi:pimeloyl-ACP methyl ester carboxylesterase